MIKFVETDKRKYDINVNDETICQLSLIFNPVSNKFNQITFFIEDAAEKIGVEFENWFKTYVREYIDSDFDQQVIIKHIPNITKYTDKYLELIEIDYTEYTSEKKRSKSSIFFSAVEIEKIIKVSYYLKLFAIFYQDEKMKPYSNFYKEIYNKLIKDISTNDILLKIFNIVTSKINKYRTTDNYMWEFIKIKYCKTTDIHIIHIFNWVNHNILVTCDAKQNPISFISSVIDTSIKWILQNVYKDSIIYSETISTEDANIATGRDKLETFAYNDTIAKLILESYKCLQYEEIQEYEFKQFISEKKQTPIISKYLTFPILSKVLQIPYKHLMTLPCEHCYLLNILLFHYLSEDFKSKFPILNNLLSHFNMSKEIDKTTYTINNDSYLYNNVKEFLSTKNIVFANVFYCNIIGKIYRNKYKKFKDSTELNLSLPRLEIEIINFYKAFFENDLQDEYQKLNEKFDNII